MTITQQTPIKNEGKTIELGLGSTYANHLGLKDISVYDGSTALMNNQKNSTENSNEPEHQKEKNGKKKKKNNKKKKKKK